MTKLTSKEPCEVLLDLSANAYRHEVTVHPSRFATIYRCANASTALLRMLEGSLIAAGGGYGEGEDIPPLSPWMQGQFLSNLIELNRTLVMDLDALVRDSGKVRHD